MVQLTLVEMAASGTTAILKVVENMMTTILSQIQSAVHVEVCYTIKNIISLISFEEIRLCS